MQQQFAAAELETKISQISVVHQKQWVVGYMFICTTKTLIIPKVSHQLVKPLIKRITGAMAVMHSCRELVLDCRWNCLELQLSYTCFLTHLCPTDNRHCHDDCWWHYDSPARQLATSVNYADLNNPVHEWSRFPGFFSLWYSILAR